MASSDQQYGEPYVCTLPPELVAKAKKELNETEKDRPKKIKQLREKVLAHPGLHCPKDDRFLLRFLRARKFDVTRAYDLIVNYYKIRAEYPEVFNDIKPSSLRHVLDAGISVVLPMKDRHGRHVWFYRPGLWKHEEYPLMDLARANLMAMEHAVEDEATQINGVIGIADFTGMNLGHVGKFDKSYAKIMMTTMQDAFPLRFKGMHMCNESFVMTYVFPIIKLFMRQKMRDRLNFHGESRKALHKEFGAAILPEELGGVLGSGDELGEKWKNILLSREQFYEDKLQYYLDLPKDIFKKQRDESTEEVTGTFRKLDI